MLIMAETTQDCKPIISSIKKQHAEATNRAYSMKEKNRYYSEFTMVNVTRNKVIFEENCCPEFIKKFLFSQCYS